MVGEEGVEPSRDCSHRILSPARLPIPPLAHGAIKGVLYYNRQCNANTEEIRMGLLPKDTNGAAKRKQTNPGYAVGKGYLGRPRTLHQLRNATDQATKRFNPAVELIRHKLDRLYADEPNARYEMHLQYPKTRAEPPRSKHQQFMLELSTSGKSLAQIQTEWHSYYLGLPDNEKHAVWREFYETNARRPSAYNEYVASQQEYASADLDRLSTGNDEPLSSMVLGNRQPAVAEPDRYETVAQVREQLLNHAETRGRSQLTAKHHLQSLAFGIATGTLVLVVFLFSFFNQVIIAPLIQPSRDQQNTPIILSTSGVAPSSTPQVIVPKINVQIPVIYSVTSTSESAVENSLENGVVH